MKIFKCMICFFLLIVLLYGCARSEYTAYSQVEEEYQKIQTNTRSENNMTEEEIYTAYADLFEGIAHGSPADRNRFAQLTREIIGDGVVFANEEVFEIAQDYATVFSRYASGNQDDGVQELQVKSTSPITAQLDFSYWGELRYSVKMIPEGVNWVSGEFTDPYKGELGKYLMVVTFNDAEPSKAFLEEYPSLIDHGLRVSSGVTNYEMTMRITSNADHGYNVYIGSNEPFHVEEQSSVIVDRPIGTISVTLYFEQ